MSNLSVFPLSILKHISRIYHLLHRCRVNWFRFVLSTDSIIFIPLSRYSLFSLLISFLFLVDGSRHLKRVITSVNSDSLQSFPPQCLIFSYGHGNMNRVVYAARSSLAWQVVALRFLSEPQFLGDSFPSQSHVKRLSPEVGTNGECSGLYSTEMLQLPPGIPSVDLRHALFSYKIHCISNFQPLSPCLSSLIQIILLLYKLCNLYHELLLSSS